MAQGRPLTFEPEQALDDAMRQFWYFGYEATSLQDLLDAMSISKSSFYQAFHSKHALFERCVRRYRDWMLQTMRDLLADAQSGRSFIEQILTDVTRQTRGTGERRGCLVMNAATEFAQRDKVIAELVTGSLDAFADVFHAAILQGQAEGRIARDKDPVALARYLVTSLGGLNIMARAGQSAASLRSTIGVILSALD